MSDAMDAKSIAILLLVAILVFAAAFYLSRQANAASIEGVRVLSSSDPVVQMRQALLGNITLWMQVPNATAVIPCEQKAATEIVYLLAAQGKKVNTVGRVGESYCVNANNTRVDCGTPNMVVREGPTQGAIVEKGRVVIEGDEGWFCDNSVRLRQMVGYVLASGQNGS